MRPDAPLAGFVRALQRREAVRGLARAAALAGLAAPVTLVLLRAAGLTGGAGTAAGVAAAAIVVAVMAGVRRRNRWSIPAVVARAESATPAFRNQLVTAVELARDASRASPRMADLVAARAAAVAGSADVRGIVPLARAATLGVAGLVAFVATMMVALVPNAAGELRRTAARLTGERPAGQARIERIEVRTTPPAYTGRAPTQVTDPARLDVLAGTQVELRIDTTAAALDVRFGDRALPLEAREPAPSASASLAAITSGALVVSAAEAGGAIVDRRVIALAVSDDMAPRVVFERPAADLVLADADQPVTLVARASDDLALTRLTLEYTKVSGSGERFEFDGGTIAWTVTRTAAGEWRATITRPPSAFGVREGDLLVYHASALDGRPGREASVSDAFVIEIGKPQAAIAGGFAIPPDEDRSAISLSALIRKTETLHGQRGALGVETFAEQAAGLAVEQRMVRTETLFMMGSHGHVEDEEVEAAHSHEIQEGRLENQGHAELLAAIRLMTLAEQRLLASDTGGALAVQRRALSALQRALSRQRYFLRTVPVRSRIDPGRRASGDLSAARSWTAAPPPVDTARAQRARALLAEAEALGRGGTPSQGPALAGFAARVLDLDPGSETLRRAAAALTGSSSETRAEAWRGVVGLLEAAAAPPIATPPGPRAGGRLAGAFVDALRPPGSGPP